MDPEKPRQFFSTLQSGLQLELKRCVRVCRQEGLRSGVIKGAKGVVENVKATYKEFLRKDSVIPFQLKVVSNDNNHDVDLVSDEFGPITEFATENETLLWAKDMLLKERNLGVQVLYPMTGCGCLEDNKIRFLVTLTIYQDNPEIVKGRSYRIEDSEPEKVENLLSVLVQKEGRELVTQEIVDENGQKHTISLLIIENEEAFIKGKEEIDAATQILQKVNQPLLTNIEPFFVNPELFKPFFHQSLPLWPRVEPPSSKEEKREPTSFYLSPLLVNRERLEIEERQAERENDHFWPQEESREILSLQSEGQEATREVNNSQSEAPQRKSQALKEKTNEPIKASKSNQEVMRAKVVLRVNHEIPLVISSLAFLTPKLYAETRVLDYVEDDLRQEIQLPQEDYLPLLEIFQAETSQQEFVKEPQSITFQEEELATQEVLSINRSSEYQSQKEGLVLEAEQQPAVSQSRFAQKENQSTKPVLIVQEQQTAEYQDQRQENHPPNQSFIEVEQPLAEKVIQVEEAEEQKAEDFIIQPKENRLPKARKMIEAIARVPERKARLIILGWQILPFRRRLKTSRVTPSLSLPAFMRGIIIPSFRKRYPNRYEQGEGKFLSALLLHSLSGIYITNQKPDSIPQSQVIFDSRWLPKVIYEAKDPLPVTDVIVPIKRKVIKADEYQEAVTIDDLTDEELNLKFLFLPLAN